MRKWDLIAIGVMVISVIGTYLMYSIRLKQSWYEAEAWVMLGTTVFEALLLGSVIAFILGKIARKSKLI